MLNLSTESQGSIRSFKSSSCSRKNITYVPLNLWYDIVLDVQCKRAGPSLGGAGPNDVLCKTCNVLLCVLEQPSVDNSSLLPLKHGAQLEAIGPIKQWRPYKKGAIFCKMISCYRKFICLCSLLPVSVFNMTLADKLATMYICNLGTDHWKFQFLTCTYLAKRLREISSTKTGSYPHEFLCRTNCSACADYQPCNCLLFYPFSFGYCVCPTI